MIVSRYRLCENFDNQLQKIATDAKYFIFDCEEHDAKDSSKQHGGVSKASYYIVFMHMIICRG